MLVDAKVVPTVVADRLEEAFRATNGQAEFTIIKTACSGG
jgi:hypothetical protein